MVQILFWLFLSSQIIIISLFRDRWIIGNYFKKINKILAMVKKFEGFIDH